LTYERASCASNGTPRRTSATSESTESPSQKLSGSSRPRTDYLEIFDADYSESEDRFIAIGPIDRGIVVIVYTEPEEDLIRIIGARLANKREQALYRSHMDRYK
jgi:hypothetical protein